MKESEGRDTDTSSEHTWSRGESPVEVGVLRKGIYLTPVSHSCKGICSGLPDGCSPESYSSCLPVSSWALPGTQHISLLACKPLASRNWVGFVIVPALMPDTAAGTQRVFRNSV